MATVGFLGVAVMAITYGGDLLHSDPPPVASVKRVAQIEKQLLKVLDDRSKLEAQRNEEQTKRNDDAATSWCQFYMGQEAQSEIEVNKHPTDVLARNRLLVNSRLEQHWCNQAPR